MDAYSPVKEEERTDLEMGKEKMKVSFFEFLEMRKLQNKRKRSMWSYLLLTVHQSSLS